MSRQKGGDGGGQGGRVRGPKKNQGDYGSLASREDPHPMATQPLAASEAVIQLRRFQRQLSRKHLEAIMHSASSDPDNPYHTGQTQRVVLSVTVPVAHVDASQGLSSLGAVVDAMDEVEIISLLRGEDGSAAATAATTLKMSECKADIVLLAALAWSWAGGLPVTEGSVDRANDFNICLAQSQKSFEENEHMFTYTNYVNSATNARAPCAVHIEHLPEYMSGSPRLKLIRINWIYSTTRGDIFAELDDAWNNLMLYMTHRWLEEVAHVRGTGCSPEHFQPGSFLRKKWDHPNLEQESDEKKLKAAVDLEKARLTLVTQRNVTREKLQASISKLANEVYRMQMELDHFEENNDRAPEPLPQEALEIEIANRQRRLDLQRRLLQNSEEEFARMVEEAANRDPLDDLVNGGQQEVQDLPAEEADKLRMMEFGLNWDAVPVERRDNMNSILSGWERLLFDTKRVQPYTHACGVGERELDVLLQYNRAGRILKFPKGADVQASPDGELESMNLDGPAEEEEEEDDAMEVVREDQASVDRQASYVSDTCLLDENALMRSCAKLSDLDPEYTERAPALPVAFSHGLHASMLSYVTPDVNADLLLPSSYFLIPNTGPAVREEATAKLCGVTVHKEFKQLAASLGIRVDQYASAAELNAAILTKAARASDALGTAGAGFSDEKRTLLKMYAKWKGYPQETLVEEIAPELTHPATIFMALIHDGDVSRGSCHMFQRLRQVSRISDGRRLSPGVTKLEKVLLFSEARVVRAATRIMVDRCASIDLNLPSQTIEEMKAIVDQSQLIHRMFFIAEKIRSRFEIQRIVFNSVPLLKFWRRNSSTLDVAPDFGSNMILQSHLTSQNSARTYLKFEHTLDILGALCPQVVKERGKKPMPSISEPVVSANSWKSVLRASEETFMERIKDVKLAKGTVFAPRGVAEIPRDSARWIELVQFDTPEKKLYESNREPVHAMMWRVLNAPPWHRLNGNVAHTDRNAFAFVCDSGFLKQCWSHTTVSSDATATVKLIQSIRERPREPRSAQAEAMTASRGTMGYSRGFGQAPGTSVSHCGWRAVGPCGAAMAHSDELEKVRWEEHYAAFVGAYHRYTDLFTANQILSLILFPIYLNKRSKYQVDKNGKWRKAPPSRFHVYELEMLTMIAMDTARQISELHAGFKWCNALPSLVTDFPNTGDDENIARSGVKLLRVVSQVLREIISGNRGGELLHSTVPHERIFNTAPNIRSMVATYITTLKDSMEGIGIGFSETQHMLTLAFLIWMQVMHVSMPQPDTKLYLAFFVILSGVTAAGKSNLVQQISNCAFPETVKILGTLSDQALTASGGDQRILRYIDELSQELFDVNSRNYKSGQVTQLKEAATSGAVNRTRNKSNQDTGNMTSKTDVISSHWNLLASSNHKFSGEQALTKRFTTVAVAAIAIRGRRHVAETTAGRAGSLAAMNDSRRMATRNTLAMFSQNNHMLKIAIEHLIEMGLLQVEAEVIQTMSLQVLNKLKDKKEYNGLMIRSHHTLSQLFRSETACVAAVDVNVSHWDAKVNKGIRDCYPRLDWRFFAEVAQPALIPSLEVAVHVTTTFFHQVADKPDEAEIFRALCRKEYTGTQKGMSASLKAFRRLKFPVVTMDTDSKEPGRPYSNDPDLPIVYADEAGVESGELALDLNYVTFEADVKSKKEFYSLIANWLPDERRISEETIASLLEMLESQSIEVEQEPGALALVRQAMEKKAREEEDPDRDVQRIQARAADYANTARDPVIGSHQQPPHEIHKSNTRAIIEGGSASLEMMLARKRRIVLARTAPGQRIKALIWKFPEHINRRRGDARVEDDGAAKGAAAQGALGRGFQRQAQAASPSAVVQLRVHWSLVAMFLTAEDGPDSAGASGLLHLVKEGLRNSLPAKLYPDGPLGRPEELRSPAPGDLEIFQSRSLGPDLEAVPAEDMETLAGYKKKILDEIQRTRDSLTFVIGYVGNVTDEVTTKLLAFKEAIRKRLVKHPDEGTFWKQVVNAVDQFSEDEDRLLTIHSFEITPAMNRGVNAPLVRVPFINPFEGSTTKLQHAADDTLYAFLTDSVLPDVFSGRTAHAVLKPDFPIGQRMVAIQVAFLRHAIRKTSIELQWHPDIYSLFEFCAYHLVDPMDPTYANAMQHRHHTLMSAEIGIRFPHLACNFPQCDVEIYLMNAIFERMVERSTPVKLCSTYLDPLRDPEVPTTLMTWANRLHQKWHALDPMGGGREDSEFTRISSESIPFSEFYSDYTDIMDTDTASNMTRLPHSAGSGDDEEEEDHVEEDVDEDEDADAPAPARRQRPVAQKPPAPKRPKVTPQAPAAKKAKQGSSQEKAKTKTVAPSRTVQKPRAPKKAGQSRLAINQDDAPLF